MSRSSRFGDRTGLCIFSLTRTNCRKARHADEHRNQRRIDYEGDAGKRLPTKLAAVEEGLRLLVRISEQAEALKALKGLGWEGDLDATRGDLSERA